MNVYELVKKSRSYRGYDPNRPVSREELVHLVACARLCPSSVNAQPLRYYLAWEPEQVAQLQALTKWARGLPQMTLPHPGMCPTAFIVICQDLTVGSSLARYQKDVGIVAQTMLLAAAEQGLGGCMIGNFQAGEVSRALHLGENLAPMLILAIGKPMETVVLTEAGPDDDLSYYRDENDVHYVPKRRLEDLLLD